MPDFNKAVFQANPTRLDISRSKFDLSHDWTGTFNTGLLIPVCTEEVLPGDTFKLNCSFVIRSTTPVAPVMDNAFADIYFFFVPNKLTLGRQMMSPSVDDANHSWSAIMGAQDSLLNMPLPASGATIPTINFGRPYPGGSESDIPFENHSLSDYLCLPSSNGVTALKRVMSCLEPLAYYSVWNNYFREPNTMNPVTFSIDGDKVLLSGGLASIGGFIGAKTSIMPVCRPHGYFGSALPWPQRNSETVEVPLGGLAPVITGVAHDIASNSAVTFVNPSTGSTTLSGQLNLQSGTMEAGGSAAGGVIAVPNNLYTDLGAAAAASVNQLRQAFAIQRWYEASARGGNTLADLTASMFGVTPSFAHSDRPEYLGGKRVPIQVEQVNNTAGTSVSTTTQMSIGSTGAYSLTYGSGSMFTKSFDTWGTILGVMCIRTHESFHQGLKRKYSRRNKFDFYWPQFANLGEQAIKEKEIFFVGGSSDDTVFGYQEAWAEYRYEEDNKCGLSRPGQLQAYWNYCNNFNNAPTLMGYLDASKQIENVDRTLQVSSSVSGFQWLANINFDIKAIRPMPTYSIPGLIDHH